MYIHMLPFFNPEGSSVQEIIQFLYSESENPVPISHIFGDGQPSFILLLLLLLPASASHWLVCAYRVKRGQKGDTPAHREERGFFLPSDSTEWFNEFEKRDRLTQVNLIENPYPDPPPRLPPGCCRVCV